MWRSPRAHKRPRIAHIFPERVLNATSSCLGAIWSSNRAELRPLSIGIGLTQAHQFAFGKHMALHRLRQSRIAVTGIRRERGVERE